MSNQSYLFSRRMASAMILFTLASLPASAQSDREPTATDEPATSTISQNTSTPDTSHEARMEFIPFRGVVVATERGSTAQASIEIVNRDTQPFEISGVEHSSERFVARVETVESGRRYRLTVTFQGEGPDGKVAEWLYLITGSEKIRIPVHTEVIPSVYTFPSAVAMGKFPLSDIKGNPETARSVAQILMVYRKNTTGFEIKVSSDIPFLNIESEQGPEGDRWENTIWLDSERVQPGDIEGTLVIETNDPEVPKLEVPVTGQILDQ